VRLTSVLLLGNLQNGWGAHEAIRQQDQIEHDSALNRVAQFGWNSGSKLRAIFPLYLGDIWQCWGVVDCNLGGGVSLPAIVSRGQGSYTKNYLAPSVGRAKAGKLMARHY